MVGFLVMGLGMTFLTAQVSGIAANSKAGQRLLQKAHLIQQGNSKEQQRKLNDNWFITNLKLKYTGCYNLLNLSEEGANGASSGLENTAVVTFTLGESCVGQDNDHAGKYAVNMYDFLDSYTESMLQEQEWRCESYRENNCPCDNADDEEACQYACLTKAGLEVCIEEYNNGDDEVFEVQPYLQCARMEEGEYNNNNNNRHLDNDGNNYNGRDWQARYQYPFWDGEYNIGPYCAEDGKSILLGVFYDEMCTVPASNDAYSYLHYGQSLPYSTESLIPQDTCISCIDQERGWEEWQNYNNNNGDDDGGNIEYDYNQWNNMEPREFCTDMYEQAAKCENSESGIIYFPLTTGCSFINDFLPTYVPTSFYDVEESASLLSVFLAWTLAITTSVLFAISVRLTCMLKMVRQPIFFRRGKKVPQRKPIFKDGSPELLAEQAGVA